jgi:hypothetical protein
MRIERGLRDTTADLTRWCFAFLFEAPELWVLIARTT